VALALGGHQFSPQWGENLFAVVSAALPWHFDVDQAVDAPKSQG
jgi:hypothetical protein